ncbi:MAG TPA: hypothetical protein PLF10_06570, partial [Dokdonella sp.]|nr:hypothetical protein [Dokdonella sp.]
LCPSSKSAGVAIAGHPEKAKPPKGDNRLRTLAPVSGRWVRQCISTLKGLLQKPERIDALRIYATLEFHAEVPSLRHEHSYWPESVSS